MCEYRFAVTTFSNGQEPLNRKCKISSADLCIHTGKVGREAFLELVNKWNSTGLIGVPNGGPVYVYVAL